MIVAVDFDGTLCRSPWPYADDFDLVGLYTMKLFRQNGGRLILWTCRHDESLADAIHACAKRGLYFDAVNENDPQHVEMWEADHGKSDFSPKVHADLYVDDKAMMCYEGIPWLKIHKFINGLDNTNDIIGWIFDTYRTPEALNEVRAAWEKYSGRKLSSIQDLPMYGLPLEPFRLMLKEMKAEEAKVA